MTRSASSRRLFLLTASFMALFTLTSFALAARFAITPGDVTGAGDSGIVAIATVGAG
ncbi:MAG: hypothetical protein AAGA69_12025 [Pseudomonadota bacterium]